MDGCRFQRHFEMATGTGKTITSLLCLQTFFAEEPYGLAIILCPYIHLVTQWKEETDKFNLESVLCFGKRVAWNSLLHLRLQEIALAKRFQIDSPKKLTVISTYATFFSKSFQQILSQINRPIMIVADEVHNLGSSSRLLNLPMNVKYRLGLSATPERFGDEEGTKGLFDYFGGVVYTLDLHTAIFDLKVLSRYTYEIYFVQLNDAEFQEYKELTRQIAQFISAEKQLTNSTQLESLLSKRSTVLNTAYAKLELLRELIGHHAKVKKTLFYCAPGQIKKVNMLLNREFNIICHR